jgi:hypothetical protein
VTNILRLKRIAFCVLTVPLTATAHGNYFPKGAFAENRDGNDILAEWFSTALSNLKEPALYQQHRAASARSYRFLWLRAFNHPICTRLDISGDGIGMLTLKILSGAGGNSGRLIESRRRPITKEVSKRFAESVTSLGFWKMNSKAWNQRGTDGAEWILEGAADGQYHIVADWSPEDGAVRTLGLQLMLDIAQMKIPPGRIY